MWTLSTHRLHTPLQDAIDQNLGSGFSKIKRTEHIFPTAEEVGSLMVKATLTPVKVCKGGAVSGCRTPRLEIPMSLKVLKPSRPQIPDKWTYYRGDARCLNPS